MYIYIHMHVILLCIMSLGELAVTAGSDQSALGAGARIHVREKGSAPKRALYGICSAKCICAVAA